MSNFDDKDLSLAHRYFTQSAQRVCETYLYLNDVHHCKIEIVYLPNVKRKIPPLPVTLWPVFVQT